MIVNWRRKEAIGPIEDFESLDPFREDGCRRWCYFGSEIVAVIASFFTDAAAAVGADVAAGSVAADIIGVAAPALVGAGESAAIGAGVGALGSAITGGDPLSGAGMGALGGALTGGIMSGFTGTTPLNNALGNITNMFSSAPAAAQATGLDIGQALSGLAASPGSGGTSVSEAMGTMGANGAVSASATPTSTLADIGGAGNGITQGIGSAPTLSPTSTAYAINPTGSIADPSALQVASANDVAGLNTASNQYLPPTAPVTASPPGFVNPDGSTVPFTPSSPTQPLVPSAINTLPGATDTSKISPGLVVNNTTPASITTSPLTQTSALSVPSATGVISNTPNAATGLLNFYPSSAASTMPTTSVATDITSPGALAFGNAAPSPGVNTLDVSGSGAGGAYVNNSGNLITIPSAQGSIVIPSQGGSTPAGGTSPSGGLFGGFGGEVSKAALGFGITAALGQMLSPPKQIPVSTATQNGALATAANSNSALNSTPLAAPTTSTGIYGPSITPTAVSPWSDPSQVQDIYGKGGGGPAKTYFTNNQLSYLFGKAPASTATAAAHGGHIERKDSASALNPHELIIHHGLVHGPGDGAADEVHASIPDGSYILRADEVAALGRGSTSSGAEILNKSFGPQQPNRGAMVKAALSNGEYVISPEAVTMIGNGDNDEGARRLDHARDNLARITGRSNRKSAANKGGALSRLIGGRVA